MEGENVAGIHKSDCEFRKAKLGKQRIALRHTLQVGEREVEHLLCGLRFVVPVPIQNHLRIIFGFAIRLLLQIQHKRMVDETSGRKRRYARYVLIEVALKVLRAFSDCIK